MKLFVFYIGGDTETSLLELHDIRFAAGETMEETYPALKKSWWGRPESLHLDCWGELTSADGHNITLRDTPASGPDRLWFVNLGGYEKGEFSELHKNVFVVAPTESKARVRALKQVQRWKGAHKDNQFEIEKLFNVEDALRGQGLFIHLEPSDDPASFVFETGYKPIGKTHTRKKKAAE
ncbi:MAG TPA: DUF1543 domain-containing protein [Patescibacteria group bacterium]|nr:DUF1543 domain-containing protein [Patescibacteria group bacterium]